MQDLETLETERNTLLAPKALSGKGGVIQKLYQDFERLIFSIAKADGTLTTEQLLSKSTYDFYRYKELLSAHLLSQRKR